MATYNFVSHANMQSIAQYIKQNFALKSENTLTGISVNGTPVVPSSGVAALTVPTQVSQLTNDSGFQANVIEAVKVNGTPLAITDKAVDITIDTTAEENQNAFSAITVGDAVVEADEKTDGLTFVAGTNVSITANAGTDTITFSATDTTYSPVVAASETPGLMTGADKSKLDGIAAGAEVNVIDTIYVGSAAQTVTGKAVTLGTAAGATVETALTDGANLPTGAAVKAFVEGKGYQNAQQVEDAIDAALTSAYKAAGSLAPAGVTSALLVEANDGKVYNLSADMTLDATTAALFVDGAVGEVIKEGTNIAVVAQGSGSYLFDTMAGFIDTSVFVEDADMVPMTSEQLAALWSDGE